MGPRLQKARASGCFGPVVLGVHAFAASAMAQEHLPTLSGTWSATALVERWSVGDWGDACGPKPSPQNAAAGTVQIAEQSGELAISGAGRAYVTNQCWEQMPGLSRASHSASARAWSNRCTTKANDPRQATVVTHVTATNDSIVLNETGEYEFHVDRTSCRASVSRSRSFKLVARAGESAKTPASSVASEAGCAEVGPPARLTVRPLRKLLRPGDSFVIAHHMTDDKGCRVAATPVFRVPRTSGDAASISVDEHGRVQCLNEAVPGQYHVIAELSGRELRVAIEVVAAAEYDRVLAERGLGPEGAGVASVEVSSRVGGGEAVATDKAKGRRALFLGVVAGVSTLLFVVGLLLLKHGRKNRKAQHREATVGLVRRYQAVPLQAARCPACSEVFPPDVRFCKSCGRSLIPSVAPPPSADRPLALVAAQGKICPVCGDRFAQDASYCGRDGAVLLPLN